MNTIILYASNYINIIIEIINIPIINRSYYFRDVYIQSSLYKTLSNNSENLEYITSRFLYWTFMVLLFSIIAAFYLYNKFLIFLLHIEIIIIMSILFIVHISVQLNASFVIFALILVVSVSEARLGLACLVLIVRSYGNDNLKSLSVVKI